MSFQGRCTSTATIRVPAVHSSDAYALPAAALHRPSYELPTDAGCWPMRELTTLAPCEPTLPLKTTCRQREGCWSVRYKQARGERDEINNKLAYNGFCVSQRMGSWMSSVQFLGVAGGTDQAIYALQGITYKQILEAGGR